MVDVNRKRYAELEASDGWNLPGSIAHRRTPRMVLGNHGSSCLQTAYIEAALKKRPRRCATSRLMPHVADPMSPDRIAKREETKTRRLKEVIRLRRGQRIGLKQTAR
jgi:hypothetical protein